MNRSVALTILAWGLFIVLIGLWWAINEYYGIGMAPYVALGAESF